MHTRRSTDTYHLSVQAICTVFIEWLPTKVVFEAPDSLVGRMLVPSTVELAIVTFLRAVVRSGVSAAFIRPLVTCGFGFYSKWLRWRWHWHRLCRPVHWSCRGLSQPRYFTILFTPSDRERTTGCCYCFVYSAVAFTRPTPSITLCVCHPALCVWVRAHVRACVYVYVFVYTALDSLSSFSKCLAHTQSALLVPLSLANTLAFRFSCRYQNTRSLVGIRSALVCFSYPIHCILVCTSHLSSIF